MRTKIFILIPILLYTSVFLFGCAKADLSSSEKEEPAEPGVVDYITGAEHIKTYKKAKSKIEEIEKTREGQYEGF